MICQRSAHKARGLLWEFVGGKVEPGETKEPLSPILDLHNGYLVSYTISDWLVLTW